MLWPPVVKSDTLEETLMLGNTEGKWRRGQQRVRLLDSSTNLMDMSLSKLREIVKNREVWSAAVLRVARVRHNLTTKQQQFVIYLAVPGLSYGMQDLVP